MARPKQKKYEVDYMIPRIEKYIESKQDSFPIWKECCLLNDWDYVYTMELKKKDPKLAESIRKVLDWKEVKLEQGALTGKLEKTMAIFSLKQLGWKDRQEVGIDTNKLDSILKAVDEID